MRRRCARRMIIYTTLVCARSDAAAAVSDYSTMRYGWRGDFSCRRRAAPRSLVSSGVGSARHSTATALSSSPALPKRMEAARYRSLQRAAARDDAHTGRLTAAAPPRAIAGRAAHKMRRCRGVERARHATMWAFGFDVRHLIARADARSYRPLPSRKTIDFRQHAAASAANTMRSPRVASPQVSAARRRWAALRARRGRSARTKPG